MARIFQFYPSWKKFSRVTIENFLELFTLFWGVMVRCNIHVFIPHEPILTPPRVRIVLDVRSISLKGFLQNHIDIKVISCNGRKEATPMHSRTKSCSIYILVCERAKINISLIVRSIKISKSSKKKDISDIYHNSIRFLNAKFLM